MSEKPVITQTKLNDGTIVRVNDHVYLTPEHLGEPYYIGRIMEFCSLPKRKGLYVRMAWYNRPKDIFNRRWYDSSMLIATMNSDLNPVSAIRGKCIVQHKYYIPKDQFEKYKATEDHFYYNQLYDRYMQRVYDILPCETVQNVPMDIQEALSQRYQYIIVEQGKASELTVARRTCCVCQTWCASADHVKCAGCQKNYHMKCVTPPLTRKPSKGFAWQCAFCSRKELEGISKTAQPSTTDVPPAVRSYTNGKRTTRLRSQLNQKESSPKKQLQQIDEEQKDKTSNIPSLSLSSSSDKSKIYEG